MKTFIQILSSIFILFNISPSIGQNKFIITGAITNVKTKTPVDSSIYVTLNLEKKEIYKVFCNHEGKYSINISDSLNGKQIIVYASQDVKKIVGYQKSEPGEPCSFECLDNKLFIESNGKKIILNADSTKKYIVDFEAIPVIRDLISPSIYFTKNELVMVQSDYFMSADSAICFIKNVLKCRKTNVFLVSGNCSPGEKDKANLSLKRAELVREKLISLGINPERVIARGYSDKSYLSNKDYVEEERKLWGDWRPTYINKTDYEWQTVTFSLFRNDFQE